MYGFPKQFDGGGGPRSGFPVAPNYPAIQTPVRVLNVQTFDPQVQYSGAGQIFSVPVPANALWGKGNPAKQRMLRLTVIGYSGTVSSGSVGFRVRWGKTPTDITAGNSLGTALTTTSSAQVIFQALFSIFRNKNSAGVNGPQAYFSFPFASPFTTAADGAPLAAMAGAADNSMNANTPLFINGEWQGGTGLLSLLGSCLELIG